ncbi:hypothetical protein F4778DRAFT_786051 [Xylariomycetidae sp. FL2044]|nr:hypothetical protein F4778DRAFT_786051 [Xylariomycetidae sp. FL2044]
MKKFGFGKKSAEVDDDTNRSTLFGKRGSPAPSDNPYAQSKPANDPYMNDTNKYANVSPYQQARAGLSSDPRAGGLPSGPGPRNGYGAPLSRNDSHASSTTAVSNGTSPGGYTNDRYGTSSGYGSNKYSSGGFGNGTTHSGRQGGYGGLGHSNSDDTDVNRDALFSGVQNRNMQQNNNNKNEIAQSGAYGQSAADPDARKYGGYGEERELTEEEKANEDVKQIKGDMHGYMDQDVVGIDKSNAIAENIMMNIAPGSLARLGAQNERLHATEQHLDSAISSQRHAHDQTRKLKSLNRSMFAVHVKNPFTEGSRTAKGETEAMAQHQADRELREASRREKYAQGAHMESTFRDLNRTEVPASFSRADRGKKSKYVMEDESDEELIQKNDHIEDGIVKLSGTMTTIHGMTVEIGKQIDHSNKLTDRIADKTDKASDKFVAINHTLNRIR